MYTNIEISKIGVWDYWIVLQIAYRLARLFTKFSFFILFIIMQKYLQYVSEFQENNSKWVEFIQNQLQKHLKENEEDKTEIEIILDYLYSNQNVDTSKIGYTTILGKTEKRHKKLQSVSTKNDEIEWIDYDVFLDFGDSFKMVVLKSKESYEREWKLMSHCVSSYYGRDTAIYSLRDENNKPHCTIEDGRQIKGKWNGKIDPKYIDYVVQFLNKKWMSVWENEMKNLWYYKIDTIDKWLTCDKSYNWYVYDGNSSLIKDKKWNTYSGFWLWNIKNIVDIKEDWKFYLFDDVNNIVDYSNLVIRELTKASSGEYAKLASSGNSAKLASSGNSAKLASSGEYAQLASSGYSAQLASSGYSAKLEAKWEKSVIAWIWRNNIAKGIIWTWIVLAEYIKEGNEYVCKNVKSAKIDWKKLKADVWYKLEWWKFVKVK